MSFDKIQQLIRIGAYMIGGAFLGEGIVESSQFDAAVGGVISVAAFVSWYFWDRARETSGK